MNTLVKSDGCELSIDLDYDGRQALGEYIILQQRKGRTELPASEIEIAIEAIRIAGEMRRP